MSLRWVVEGIKEALCASEHHLSLGLGSLPHIPSAPPLSLPSADMLDGVWFGEAPSLCSLPGGFKSGEPRPPLCGGPSPSSTWPCHWLKVGGVRPRIFTGCSASLWWGTTSGGERERWNPMRDGGGAEGGAAADNDNHKSRFHWA
jgi:hypothetical protein